jgi:hypothetical protein
MPGGRLATVLRRNISIKLNRLLQTRLLLALRYLAGERTTYSTQDFVAKNLRGQRSIPPWRAPL